MIADYFDHERGCLWRQALSAAQVDRELTTERYLLAENKRTRLRMALERMTTFMSFWHWSTHPRHKRKAAKGCGFCLEIESARKVQGETGLEF